MDVKTICSREKLNDLQSQKFCVLPSEQIPMNNWNLHILYFDTKLLTLDLFTMNRELRPSQTLLKISAFLSLKILSEKEFA